MPQVIRPCAGSAWGAALMLAALLVHPVTAADEHNVAVTPQEHYEGRDTFVTTLPDELLATKPLRLDIAFNTIHPANSPEADAFLKRWYETLSSYPQDVTLKVSKTILPADYAYVVSLTFKNWEAYRAHETRPEFLEYYYDDWRPNVPKWEERLTLLDTVIE